MIVKKYDVGRNTTLTILFILQQVDHGVFTFAVLIYGVVSTRTNVRLLLAVGT